MPLPEPRRRHVPHIVPSLSQSPSYSPPSLPDIASRGDIALESLSALGLGALNQSERGCAIVLGRKSVRSVPVASVPACPPQEHVHGRPLEDTRHE